MNKTIYIIGILLGIGLSSFAQPYVYDSSFQPYFDIRLGTTNAGTISSVWENPKNGKLFISGNFSINGGSGVSPHGTLTQVGLSGNYIQSFSTPIQHGSGGGALSFQHINTNLIGLSAQGSDAQIDTFGTILNNAYNNNFFVTTRCKSGYSTFFYQDGSALWSNGLGTPGSCQIYSYNDTFPHQYIVKVNNQGLYDSTFKVYPNKEPSGFVPYDSNRILVFGLPYQFTHYNGRKVDGLCRIFYDGTLDTTFQSPFKDTAVGTSINLELVDIDGSIFIAGGFFLKNDTAKIRTLIKLKPNGEIDSSFTNFFDIYYSIFPIAGGIVRTIEKTPDGGYLVGGNFDRYQGVAKNHIVKVNANGVIEPQYFNTLGPDSSAYFHNWAQPPGITGITKSKFGGYYVYGDFLKWDGQPSQPIVRIHDLLTGVEIQKQKAESLELFPNPVQDELRIQIRSLRLRSLSEFISIQVFNLLGKEQKISLTNESKTKATLNTAAWSKGVYLLQVKTSEGMHSKKIVKN